MLSDQIPVQLRSSDRWIVWKKEKRNGKFTKVPYDAKAAEDHIFAKTNDPTTWASFAAAQEVANRFDADFDGVGFMLQGSEFVGIDFDGVVDDGIPEPYVLNILSQLGDPYCEVTPSSTGLRVFIECPALPPGNRKFNAKKKGTEKYAAEIYTGSEGGRYLTVTGERYSGSGIPVVADLELVYFLISRFPDGHFRRLWMGDSSDYENDDSRVDLALLGVFARAFQGDATKILKFFNASVPGHREKWLTRPDYRDRTLQVATSGLALPDREWQKVVDQPRYIIDFHGVNPAEEIQQKWTAFDYVVEAQQGQFDGWFPLGSPSLLGGSSGSGKTTWMLDLCVAQKEKREFYGHRTGGRPYIVLMLDRGKDSHTRTMHRLGFAETQVPIKFLKAAVDGEASQQIIDAINQTDPLPELVFVEGMDMLVSDPSALEVVMPFMHEMQQIAEHYHLALVGSVGAPKTKPREGYAAKRDTIFGSAVWSRMSETIVTMQYPNGDDTADRRVISILPRNAKSETFETEFQHGRLAVAPPVETEQAPTLKEREAQDVKIRAEHFIQSFLKDGPKWQGAVLEAVKQREEGIGQNAVRDAAARLYKRGRLIYDKNGKHESIWRLLPLNEGPVEPEAGTYESGDINFAESER